MGIFTNLGHIEDPEKRREKCCHYYKLLGWCIEDVGPSPSDCRTWRNLLKYHSCIPEYKTRYCTKDPILDPMLERLEARERAEAQASQKKDH